MNKNKIYIGLGVILLFILGLGGFFIFKIQNMKQDFETLEGAEHVITSALDFNVENFHTQLEMWEYAFDPNQTRLRAFRKHQTTLDGLLIELVAAIQEPGATFEGGDSEIEEIRANVAQVNADWERLLISIGKLEDLKAKGIGEGSEEYEIFEAQTVLQVIANEELFDRLEFNKTVNGFVEKQEAHVDKIEDEIFGPVNSFNQVLYVYMPSMLVLIVVVGIWMSATKKKEQPQQQVSQSPQQQI